MSSGPVLHFGEYQHPLYRIVTRVGRRSQESGIPPDIDLAAFDRGRRTSRRHAELFWAEGAIYLRDVGSTNGTFVNEQPIPAHQPVPLLDGDQVSFGGVVAVFVRDAPWPPGLTAEWTW